jgi:hypothetical protein
MEGVDMPLGIWPLSWTSAEVACRVMLIIAQDVLGYNAFIGPGDGRSLSAVTATAGCLPGVESAECRASPAGRGVPRYQLSFEGWPNAMLELKTWQAEHPHLAPEWIGTMGYQGNEGAYIANRIKEEGVVANGMHLDYYGNYNASWFNPALRFRNISSINTSFLETCDSQAELFENYLQIYRRFFASDTDGYVVENGITKVHCPDGYWWLSPSCRADPDSCVPFVTSYPPWGANIMMQQSNYYNMPVAIAICTNWSTFVEIVQTHDVINHWWMPDTAFVNLYMHLIQFPPNDPDQSNAGLQVTAQSGKHLDKYAARNLRAVAPRVHEVASRMSISMQSMMGMLSAIDTGMSVYDAACQWLNSTDSWRDWVPDATACLPGQGVVDKDGQFLSSRAEASSCNWCPLGSYSRENRSDGGLRTCELCEPGKAQGMPGTTSCPTCSVGTYAGAGSSECTRCEVGKHAVSEGQSACANCAVGRIAAESGRSSCVGCGTGTFSGLEGSTR